MARVIKSAYDRFPHAFRRDDLALRSCPETSSAAPVRHGNGAAPASRFTSAGFALFLPDLHGGPISASVFSSGQGAPLSSVAAGKSSGHGGGGGQVHERGRLRGSKSASSSSARASSSSSSTIIVHRSKFDGSVTPRYPHYPSPEPKCLLQWEDSEPASKETRHLGLTAFRNPHVETIFD